MIFITGDTHGGFDMHKLSSKSLKNRGITLTSEDYLVVLGDFGFPFLDKEADEKKGTYTFWMKWFAEKPYTVLWVDGNHENFNFWDKQPVTMWHGGKVQIHPKAPNVIHLMRGQVFDIDGSTFFTMGGAASTDRMFRVTGLSWWTQELPCTAEYDEAKRNLERCGHTVDYILTHTPPTSVLKLLCPYPAQSDHLTDFLEEIDSSVSFKHWFFGHIHVDNDVDRYSALYQRIIALSPLDDVICHEISSDSPTDDNDTDYCADDDDCGKDIEPCAVADDDCGEDFESCGVADGDGCGEDIEACAAADDDDFGVDVDACGVTDDDDCGEDFESCGVADDDDCGEDIESCGVTDDDDCGGDIESCGVADDDDCGEDFEDEFGRGFFESVMSILHGRDISDDDDLYYDYYDDDDDEVIELTSLFKPKSTDTSKKTSNAADKPTDTAGQPSNTAEEPHHVLFTANRSDRATCDNTDTHSAEQKSCHSLLSYLTISTVSAGICICLLMLLDVKFKLLDCIDLHAFRRFDISNFSFIAIALSMLFVIADALIEKKRTTYAAIIAGTAPVCIFTLGSIYILMLHEVSLFSFFASLALIYALFMAFLNFIDDSVKDSSGQKTIANDLANALGSTKRALPVFILSAVIGCAPNIGGIFDDLSEYAVPDTRTSHEIRAEIVSTYYDDPEVPPLCNLGIYVDYGYYDYYFIRFAPEAWQTQTCEEKLDALQALVNINTSKLGLSRAIAVRATRLDNNAVANYDQGKARIYFDNSALDNASVPELIDAVFFNCRRAYQYEYINDYLRSLGNATTLDLYPDLPMWMSTMDDYVYSDASVSSEGALDFIRTDADADAARYRDRFSDAFMLYLETLCAERLISTDCGTHKLNDNSVSIFMHDTHLSLFMGRDLGIPRSLGTITFPDEVEHDSAAKSLAIKDINDDGLSDICYENDDGQPVTFIGNDGKFLLLI